MSFEKDRKLKCDACNNRIYVKPDGTFEYHLIKNNGPCPNSGALAH